MAMEPQSRANTSELSSLQTLLLQENNDDGATSTHPSHLTQLALQIKHNLQHQHLWTDLRIHAFSPRNPSIPLPRPLISGLPPQRLYVHPDEQIALLQAQKAAGGTGMGNLLPEREWVLPSHLREKWSLRKFGDVFDGITILPLLEDGETEEEEVNRWRTEKRVLLATVDDDSTIVYYIVHDGIVKPRQN